jgi:hypothetical protein
MTISVRKEIIIIRSLTGSDLGLFAALRPSTVSKQRAININAAVAHRLFSPDILSRGEAFLDCRIIFGDTLEDSRRYFGKTHKNWRLGGDMIEGPEFASLDSRDFALIRSVEQNDGSSPLTILLISKTEQRLKHAAIARMVEYIMKGSMAIVEEGNRGFRDLAVLFPERKTAPPSAPGARTSGSNAAGIKVRAPRKKASFPPMPADPVLTPRKLSVKEKVRSPRILEQMLKVSGDLSAKGQMEFLEIIGLLAQQLREALLKTNRIIRLEKNHARTWQEAKDSTIGFIDGGLANLSMLGSAPIAARVGGYIVRPGDDSEGRERFIMLKWLINELYTDSDGGVYGGSFPDTGALRDAARISIEAAGAVMALGVEPALHCLFLHGALVNPISRYTDVMQDRIVRFPFPAFSPEALEELLPGVKPVPVGRHANFIAVYLRQLQLLENSRSSICGVVEREATTTSVIRHLLNSLEDDIIAPILSRPPAEWKQWFRSVVNPVDNDESLGQRITDSLLFRCVLEAGEALVPVEITNRNDMQRAPQAWQDLIIQYPRPWVSYLQPTDWSSPVRMEIFDRDRKNFAGIANLVYHSSLLLPRYAFPVGLDIVDKFVKIPDWMSRPVNTSTVVQALKMAMNKGDEKLFDTIRWMLCGSDREWMFRPRFNR